LPNKPLDLLGPLPNNEAKLPPEEAPPENKPPLAAPRTPRPASPLGFSAAAVSFCSPPPNPAKTFEKSFLHQ